MKRIYLRLMFLTLFTALISNTSSASAGVLDTTKIGVEVGDTKSWTVDEFKATGIFEGFLDDEDDIKKGDKFSLEVKNVTLDNEDSIEVEYTAPDGTKETDKVFLGEIGEDIVFTDWAFWKTQMENVGYSVTDGSSTFEFTNSSIATYVQGDDVYDFWELSNAEQSESTVYDKTTGFMKSFNFLVKWTYINGTTYVIEISVGEGSSGDDDDDGIPGFEFTTILAAFSIMLIPIILKKKNQDP